jgi:hypothetical protein
VTAQFFSYAIFLFIYAAPGFALDLNVEFHCNKTSSSKSVTIQLPDLKDCALADDPNDPFYYVVACNRAAVVELNSLPYSSGAVSMFWRSNWPIPRTKDSLDEFRQKGFKILRSYQHDQNHQDGYTTLESSSGAIMDLFFDVTDGGTTLAPFAAVLHPFAPWAPGTRGRLFTREECSIKPK